MSDELLVPKNFGVPAPILNNVEDDEIQGVRGSFAVLATPSKNEWVFRYQRKDQVYTDDEGNPKPNIEVVIVKTRTNVSNEYYGKWDANVKHAPPLCFATDGKVPDASVPAETKQNPICEGCKQKIVGSAITATGDPTTACRNIRKLAVIPIFHLLDRKFDEYGGPMLFRLTPTSLKNHMEYVDRIKAMGHKVFGVVTRMRFDPAAKHQKIIFSPFRALTAEEAQIALELRNDPRTANVLNQTPEIIQTDNMEEETKPIPTTQAPKPVAPKAPPPPAPKAPPPPAPRGVAATPQTVAEAVNNPAARPTTTRVMKTAPTPAPQEEPEESLDEETGPGIGDSLPGELDDALKQLLGG